MTLPVIAVVIGDPGGIGPEVCIKALAGGELDGICRPLLIGDVHALRLASRAAGLSEPIDIVDGLESMTPGRISVLDPGTLRATDYRLGEPSAASGQAVMQWIRLAENLARSGAAAGWIMAPVDGTSLRLAGEIQELDDLQPDGTFLLRVSGKLRVVPITEHIPIRAIPGTVVASSILNLIRLVANTFTNWGIANPSIAVAGLNPHAMGDEEQRQIAPAIAAAQAEGIDCRGPISPDAIFRQGLEGRHDVIVSMYHDQGQIALKTAAFAGACSIYIGQPFIHLTIPHGSGMDIAGQNLAQHFSMLSALKTAAALASRTGFLT